MGFLYCAIPDSFPVSYFSEYIKKGGTKPDLFEVFQGGGWLVGLFLLGKEIIQEKEMELIKARVAGEIKEKRHLKE